MSFQFSYVQKTLIDYWRSLPRNHHDILPCKKDVNIPDIAKISPNLGMAEDCGKNHLYIRLFGSAADKNFGKSVQQSNSFDYYQDDAKDWLNDHYRNLFDTPAGVTHKFAFRFPEQGRYYQDVMHLPMCDEDGVCKFLISTFERGEYCNDKDFGSGLVRVKDFRALRTIDIGHGAGKDHYGVDEKEILSPIKLSDYI